MRKMIKTAAATSLLALAVVGTTATAGPVSSLYFQQTAGWDGTGTAIFTPGTSGYTGLDFSTAISPGIFGRMAWNDIDIDQSFIDVFSFNSGNSDTLVGTDDNVWEANEFMVITELLHSNYPLTLAKNGQTPAQLWVADTIANFIVKTADESTTLVDDDDSTTIKFAETRNVATGSCPTPAPLGTRCDDIFKVELTEFDSLFFTYDGYKYAIDFKLFPGPSTNQGNPAGTTLVCVDAGCNDEVTVVPEVPENEVWVFTPEYRPGTSSLFVGAQWRVVGKVPEPSILALFGAGILGLGVIGRRRKQRIQ